MLPSMYQSLNSKEDFSKFLSENKLALVYFSNMNCQVCTVLKPKIASFLDMNYPLIGRGYVDTLKSPVPAAQERVFAIPTIILYYEGKEQFRKSRNFGVDELSNLIEKVYWHAVED